MVTVFIWDFEGKDVAWGHASMRVGDTYISWWPTPDGRTPKSSLFPSVYSAPAFARRTLEDDLRDEGGRLPHVIHIEGLDETAIRNWWRETNPQAHDRSGPLNEWTTLSQNCSTIVARAITVGGGAQRIRYFQSMAYVWTPNEVRKYAEAVAACNHLYTAISPQEVPQVRAAASPVRQRQVGRWTSERVPSRPDEAVEVLAALVELSREAAREGGTHSSCEKTDLAAHTQNRRGRLPER